LEDCFGLYTKVDTLTDFQCRRCAITDTITTLKREIETSKKKSRDSPNGKEPTAAKAATNGANDRVTKLQQDIETLEHALRTNVEQQLVRFRDSESEE
jgi:hypothetical protein